ncbi:hypothetical protein ACQJBY_017005 [Aegilops geniculata]
METLIEPNRILQSRSKQGSEHGVVLCCEQARRRGRCPGCDLAVLGGGARPRGRGGGGEAAAEHGEGGVDRRDDLPGAGRAAHHRDGPRAADGRPRPPAAGSSRLAAAPCQINPSPFVRPSLFPAYAVTFRFASILSCREFYH